MAETPNKPTQPSSTPPEKKTTTTTDKKSSGGGKGLLVVLIILVLLMGGGLIYLYLQNEELKQNVSEKDLTIGEQKTEIDSRVNELEDLSREFDQIMAERDALGLSNDSLSAQQAELQAQIKKYKNIAYSNSAQKKKLEKEIKRLTAEYTLKLDEQTKEIERLRNLNDSLSADIDSLVTERGTVLAENADLSDKVRIASVLKAENLKVTTFNDNGKEYDKDEHRARKIEKVKVKFNFGTNKVAEKGKKTVYMLLKDPAGTVLFDINKGGGSMMKADSSNEFYTSKKEVDFYNENREVEFFYELGEDEEFEEGSYMIEIYESGYTIGEGELKVK